ncbi:MAG: 50S ribosomal protein L18 [Candidatus Sumerlaeia bacterium]
MMAKTKQEQKRRRQLRVRRKIIGTAERPRLAIRRSLRHITALVVDDRSRPDGSLTLIQVTTSVKANREAGHKSCNNQQWAKILGASVAALAKEKGITRMVFDRGGMKYHGVIKAFCETVRENGVKI